MFGQLILRHLVDVLRAGFEVFRRQAELFQQVDWNCIVFDEAQNLKNITTKRTTAARKLRAGFKVCLTGTPLENHYGEFYSLFDLIVPGSLGDLSFFRERYVNPPRVLKEEIDDLRLKVKPLLLRRTKNQVMSQLPPKVEQTVKLPFDEEQKKIYRDIASSYNEQVRSQIATQGEAKSQLQMLTALLRLRQVCSDPSSVPGVKYNGEPPKRLTTAKAITPNNLHFVRNHGGIPIIDEDCGPLALQLQPRGAVFGCCQEIGRLGKEPGPVRLAWLTKLVVQWSDGPQHNLPKGLQRIW